MTLGATVAEQRFSPFDPLDGIGRTTICTWTIDVVVSCPTRAAVERRGGVNPG